MWEGKWAQGGAAFEPNLFGDVQVCDEQIQVELLLGIVGICPIKVASSVTTRHEG